MTFKPEFIEKKLYDLVEPYSIMDWRTYGMMTSQEKALAGGLIENPGGYHNGHSKQYTEFIVKQIYLD